MEFDIRLLVGRYFPSIFEEELIEELVENASVMELDEGDTIIKVGQTIRFIPLILRGSVKVLRHDEEGNDLLLYFIGTGESCAMSLNCCMGHKISDITAVAESQVDILAIPVQKMDEWLGKYKTWRNFVFNTYQYRFDELLHTLDSIAFQNLDQRLHHYLEEKARVAKKKVLEITHQQIAKDLNSSREVISRLLKQMEKEKLIKQGRNRIEILELVGF